MTSYEDVEAKMLESLMDHDTHSDEATKTLKNLQVLSNLKPKPEPLTPVEVKPSWLEQHSDVLIKSGFSFLSVALIVGGEKLANHIYNTKAFGILPK